MLILPALAVVVSSIAVCAIADTIWVGTVERKDVKIKNFRNAQIEFTIEGRPAAPQPAEKVSRLALDDEPTFSKADQDFAAEHWARASDGYQAAIKETTKSWLKDWMLPRLLIASDRAGQFDIAVSAFIQLLQNDPTQATRLRPRLPRDTTTLSAAAVELAKAIGNANLSLNQKQAILCLQMDVFRVQGDIARAGQVSQQLLKLPPTNTKDPAAARTLADIHLGIAQLAMARKDYAMAISEIEANQALFIVPAQQAEALYCQAQAMDAKAGPAATGDILKDIALGYMRVVAISRGTPSRQYIPESLVRVAEIQEELGDPRLAAALYGEVVSEYKDSSVAANATAQQQRLKSKVGI